MDIAWGSTEAKKFVTNVGLITTDGPVGQDVMAAEWTHQISYSPGIIVVNINASNQATAKNIEATKQFGVNLAATDQNTVASIAGGSSGKNVDKVKALKDIGVEFYSGKKIKAPMIKDAALNIECKLIKSEKMGSHIAFFGEVVDVHASGKEPLAFHGGKYWILEKEVEKPSDRKREEMKKVVEKYARN